MDTWRGANGSRGSTSPLRERYRALDQPHRAGSVNDHIVDRGLISVRASYEPDAGR
jgi:hypothetical protein